MSELDDLFDKKYGARMREQTDQDFSEADWAALAGRLDEADRRRHRIVPIWVTGGLAGLLLLSNLGWFFAFDSFKKEVRQLGGGIFSSRDTVFKTIVERRVDTVFEKSVQYLPATGFAKRETMIGEATENEFLAELNRRFPQAAAHLFEKRDAAGNGFVGKKPGVADSPIVGNGTEITSGKAAAKPFGNFPKIGQRNPYPLLSRPKPLIFMAKSAETVQPTTTDAARKKPQIFKNDWWQTSYSGGLLLPVSDDLTQRNGYSVGAQVEYGFTPNHSVWLELSQSSITCTGDGTDDYGIDIPYRYGFRVAQFETIKGPKKSDRLGLGYRWRQDGGKKWGRLGLGLGYVWEYQDAFNIYLDWEDLFDPKKHEQENLLIPKETYAIGYLHGDIGMEWRLGRAWLASVNVWKEAKGHFTHGMPGYFGAKAGLGYKF